MPTARTASLITPAHPRWQGYRAASDPLVTAALAPFRNLAPIWVVTSGEAGMRAQALALAEALAPTAPDHEWAWTLAEPWRTLPAALTLNLWRLADRLTPRRFLPDTLRERLHQPLLHAAAAAPAALNLPLLPWHDPLPAPPQLIIACGRRVIAPVLWLKHLLKPRPQVIYVQDPRTLTAHFDLIVAPAHDPIRGKQVVNTPLVLHRITPERLAQAAQAWQPRWAHYPKPWWGLIVGGPSRSVAWDETLARAAITAWLFEAQKAGATLFASTSRRTPAATRAWLAAAIAERLPESPPPFTGTGENPYLAILALTDARAVTSDSLSMLSETVAAPGTSVRLAVGDYRPRLQRFHALWDRGA
ncbi:mitochondrial fission ELM1 family protein [Hydrogenophilus islandicus]